jgi:hypothetical protein
MPSLGEPARQCTALHLAARPVFVDQAWETHYKFEPKANSRPSQSLTTNSRPPPWHVAKFPRNLHTLACVLGIKRIGTFDQKVCVQ